MGRTVWLTSQIQIVGVNPYVPVPREKASRVKRDWRGPMPVRYRVKGKPKATWAINMMPVHDGSYRLYLNGQVRKAANLKMGDQVELTIQFDNGYRHGPQHPMPPWFGDELARNHLAMHGWKLLSPSRQKEILRYFANLKSLEAKRRNLNRAIHVLAGGKARFMARYWNQDEAKAVPEGHGRTVAVRQL